MRAGWRGLRASLSRMTGETDRLWHRAESLLHHQRQIDPARQAYAAIVASMLGHGVYYLLMQRHPVAQVTPYLLATPLLATVLGIVFLHDQVGPRLWIGGAMVLGGVLAIALRNLAKARPTAPAEEI